MCYPHIYLQKLFTHIILTLPGNGGSVGNIADYYYYYYYYYY
jgi:hypothetical protein